MPVLPLWILGVRFEGPCGAFDDTASVKVGWGEGWGFSVCVTCCGGVRVGWGGVGVGWGRGGFVCVCVV